MSDPIKDHKLADLSDSYYHDEIIELANGIALDIGAYTHDTEGNIVGINEQAFADSFSSRVEALIEIAWRLNDERHGNLPNQYCQNDIARMKELVRWLDAYVPERTMEKWHAYSRLCGVRSGMCESLEEELYELNPFDEPFNIRIAILPDNWKGAELFEKCGLIWRTHDLAKCLLQTAKFGEETNRHESQLFSCPQLGPIPF